MGIINFLHKFEEPVASDYVNGVIIGADLRDLVNDEDDLIIKNEWKLIEGKAFSKPGSLASLIDTTDNGMLVARPTDFQLYSVISRTSEKNYPLSRGLYNNMRIATVGSALYSSDNKVLVHRRPVTATHIANRYDGSVAGFVFNEDGRLDFRKAILSKLQRELGFTEEELEKLKNNVEGYRLRITSIHNSPDLDFSGMVDFRIDVPLTFEQLRVRANEKYMPESIGVDVANLIDFVYNHFVNPKESEELIADGVASLLSSLSYADFLKAVSHINKDKTRINFKVLRNGVLL